MPVIVLNAMSAEKEPIQATFDPDHGMRLLSFNKGKTQVIAGESGPIGPHAGRLHPEVHPDAYVDGVAHHAPWKVEATDNTIRARLAGTDQWNGLAVSAREGQGFKMEIAVFLTSDSLAIDCSVVADADALIGYGCYFKVGKGQGRLVSSVQAPKEMPEGWDYDEAQHRLAIPLSRSVKRTFHPYPNPLSASIQLDAGAYRLELRYRCQNAENSWQLHRDPVSSTVYLASMAAKSPSRPVLTVNSIHTEWRIL